MYSNTPFNPFSSTSKLIHSGLINASLIEDSTESRALIFLLTMLIKENKRYNTYKKIYKVIDKNYNYL